MISVVDPSTGLVVIQCSQNSDVLFWFSLLRDASVAVAAVVGAVQGGRGLSAWRKRQIGAGRIQCARNFFKSSLQVRDALKLVRNPFMSTGEMVAALKKQKMTDKEIREKILSMDTSVHVYQERWKDVMSAIQSLENSALEAEVLWGKPIRDLQNQLLLSVKKYKILLDEYLSEKELGSRFKVDGKRLIELHKTIFDQSDSKGEDSFGTEVANTIGSIEEMLKPYLRG